MKQKIMDWYKGSPPTKEERLAEMIRHNSGFSARQLQKYHWTAMVARWAVKEYKWVVGTVVAVGGLYIAYLALKN